MNKFIREERSFLQGARSRISELKYVLGVVYQFYKGFRKMHFLGPCVTVFGSARFKEDHPYYEMARKVSAEISKLGFAIMTGGGPGVMWVGISCHSATSSGRDSTTKMPRSSSAGSRKLTLRARRAPGRWPCGRYGRGSP